MVDLSTSGDPSSLYHRDTQSEQQDPSNPTEMCLNILTTFACGHTSTDWVPTVPHCDLNLNFHSSPLVQESNPAVCAGCLNEAYDMSWDSDFSFDKNPTPNIEVTPTETPSTPTASGSNGPGFCSLLFTEEDGTIDYDAMGEFPTSPLDRESISETDELELLAGYHVASESLYLSGQPYDFTETSGTVSYELGPVPEPVFITESLNRLEPPADNTMQMNDNMSYDSLVLRPLNSPFNSLPDSLRATGPLHCLEPSVGTMQMSRKTPCDARMLRVLDGAFDSLPDSARTRGPLYCLEPSVDGAVQTSGNVSHDALALRALDKTFVSRR